MIFYFLYLIGVIFIIIGIVIVIIDQKSKKWEQTKGTITKLQIDKRKTMADNIDGWQWMYSLNIAYEYIVKNEQIRTGNRIFSVGTGNIWSTNSDTYLNIKKKIKSGTNVKVYYKLDDDKWSCLVPGSYFHSYTYIAIGILLLFIFFGIHISVLDEYILHQIQVIN